MTNWKIIKRDIVDSTNDEAITLAEKRDLEDFVVIANKQIKGRGRRGRAWLGEKGNLFSSFGIKKDDIDIGHLSFATAVALHDVISKSIKEKVELKWPNDILINDSKASGVLIEQADNNWIIIGIGVNIKTSPKLDDASYGITCLQDHNQDINKDDFFNKLCDALYNRIYQLKNKGFESIRKDWIKNAKGLDKSIKVNLPRETIIGKFIDIDNNGLLLLEAEDKKIKKISAGDVFFS